MDQSQYETPVQVIRHGVLWELVTFPSGDDRREPIEAELVTIILPLRQVSGY